MKKILALSLMFAIVLSISIVPAFAETGALADGEYSFSTNGFGGPLPVTVSIKDNAISEIVIGENYETPGVGSRAIEFLPGKIVEAQSTGIDAITSATETSNGIFEAVNLAIEAAGGNVADWAQYEYEDLSAAEPEEISADVVVVGGGGAGLSAALSAVDNGASVIILEKTDFLGGNTAMSEGNCIITGSEYEKKIAEENVAAGNEDYKATLTDTAEELYNDIMITGHFLSNPDTLKVYTETCGEAWDFIIDNTTFDAYSTAFKGAAVEGKTVLRAYAPTINRGAEFTVPMEKSIVESGLATILTRTEGYELIFDEASNAVSGVLAVNNQNGQKYIVKANNGVILATGTMTGETAAEYGVAGVYNRGRAANTGDGQRMALAVGADTWLMGLSARGGRMVTDNFENKPGTGISIAGLADLFSQGGAIAVEEHGRRFSDENAILGNNELIANLSGGKYYAVMDRASFDNFLYVKNGELVQVGAGNFEYDKWLEQNNCEAGGIAHGATLLEAAANAGIDGDWLNATVQYYNYCIASGTPDMYKRADAAPISLDGEIVIMRLQPAYNSSSGGILVNEDCAVVNTAGDVIDGLYAAGSVAGGANGEVYYMGGTVGWSITSGYISGQVASAK